MNYRQVGIWVVSSTLAIVNPAWSQLDSQFKSVSGTVLPKETELRDEDSIAPAERNPPLAPSERGTSPESGLTLNPPPTPPERGEEGNRSTHEIGYPIESSLFSQTPVEDRAEELDITPEILEGSPVLQEWLEEVPDVLDEIRHDPSFRTRIRFGYSEFPSTDGKGGFHVGVEDIFIGETGLTVSGEYQQTFDGDERRTWGGDVRYHVLPLGGYVNIAPVLGYRNIETGNYSTDGINVGARLMLVLSRTGAADISLTQSFVSPGSDDEVGITTLSVGYALTSNLRLSTDIQKQNSREEKDSRVGIGLEWMP